MSQNSTWPHNGPRPEVADWDALCRLINDTVEREFKFRDPDLAETVTVAVHYLFDWLREIDGRLACIEGKHGL